MSTSHPAPSADYAAFIAGFRADALWDEVMAPGPVLNACIACCDRHPAGRVALIHDGKGGRTSELTFGELKERAERFAHTLVRLGVQPGDRIAAMLPRIPELLVVMLGAWRAGAVYVPLFTAFGPKAIETRVKGADAKLVVTDAVNRPKLNDVEGCPPVVLVDRGGGAPGPGDHDFDAELARSAGSFAPVPRQPGDLFLMLFTSGTTGSPKGVGVPLTALAAFLAYMRYAIDLRPEDRFWNIADPGWAYGLYYAATGPLLMGHATLFCEEAFSVDSFYRVVKQYGITNLAGAPTAYRLLMAAGEGPAAPVKGQLRVVSSAGEPLNAEVIRWFARSLAVPIHDHYGQTEMGMVLCNHHALAHRVHEGAAGLALPGYRIVVIDDGGRELRAGEQGQLAIDRQASPLMTFAGYWQRDALPASDRYYLTGDTAEQNDDGTISFFGRADDVITSSGYRIGPFDVESALIEHPAVAETAVIGKPDPERTEVVKAFIILKPGVEATPALAEELRQHVRHRLSAHAYPREIDFVAELPKTPSGKIQRFILRNAEVARAAT
ncbi:AMP-binding protein [Chelatococcus reniformis]|uniref:AMP-binding protein n=1 Tax=Chelatococcus reniformis TaxID=1494448 RepID=A0A916UML8_9HYPH|nr:AMP-binding protein [Chelatococcus reniformis]GGC78977.1 AMP-binding protein [Chelatococcus reniformis]